MFEIDPDILVIAPDYMTAPARGCIAVRQQQFKSFGKRIGVVNFEPRSCVRSIGQRTSLQLAVLQSDPGRVTDRPAP